MSSWVLTAFGEELLFAGVIFTLWHLPGYIVVGHAGGALYGRLGRNLASWLLTDLAAGAGDDCSERS